MKKKELEQNEVEERKKRLNAIYLHLRGLGKVHTKKEFAVGLLNTENMNRAMTAGDKKYLTDNLFEKIYRKYEEIFNEEFVLNGTGAMLRDDIKINAHENNYSNNVYSSIEVDKHIAGMIEIQKGLQEIIKEKDRQIGKLIDLLERKGQ